MKGVCLMMTELSKEKVTTESTETKQKKQKKQSCAFVPGRACLNCPYDDCVTSSSCVRTSKEERMMTSCGFPPVTKQHNAKTA